MEDDPEIEDQPERIAGVNPGCFILMVNAAISNQWMRQCQPPESGYESVLDGYENEIETEHGRLVRVDTNSSDMVRVCMPEVSVAHNSGNDSLLASNSSSDMIPQCMLEPSYQPSHDDIVTIIRPESIHTIERFLANDLNTIRTTLFYGDHYEPEINAVYDHVLSEETLSILSEILSRFGLMTELNNGTQMTQIIAGKEQETNETIHRQRVKSPILFEKTEYKETKNL